LIRFGRQEYQMFNCVDDIVDDVRYFRIFWIMKVRLKGLKEVYIHDCIINWKHLYILKIFKIR
jgi:hypothetical protein